jgi:hypothetical protein
VATQEDIVSRMMTCVRDLDGTSQEEACTTSFEMI